MTENLRRAYRDLASDARDYVEVAAVLSSSRRHTVVPALVAVATAVAAIAVAAVVVAGRPDSRLPAPPAPSATGAPAVRLSPPPAAPVLPATGPVGTGELVYAACARTCPPYLLLTNGRQLRLPLGTPQGVTLSPDGRWLGTPVAGGGYTVRDLGGPVTHRLAGPVDPWAWSPNSRWLLLAQHNDGTVRRYVRLDVASGQTVDHVPVDAQLWGARAVLPGGDLLLVRAEGETSLGLRTVDAATGTERSRRTLDLSAGVEPGESPGIGQVSLDASGATALVSLFTANETGEFARPSALIQVDLASGRVLARRVPPVRPARTPPGSTPWISLGLVDGAALVRRPGTGAAELLVIRLDTGALRVGWLLPPDAQVVARGSGRV